MEDEQVIELIKQELDKTCPFTLGGYTYVANRLFNKIKAYVYEEKKYAESKRVQRVIAYRVLSMLTEGLIVYAVTGYWEFSVIIASLCLIVHSSLHYLIDKIIR